MARTPRAPKPIEAAPPEPDLLDEAAPPSEAARVVGHRAERARLVASFATTPPQAVLLEGPRGVGKATLAFCLAKALLSDAPLSEALTVDPQARAAKQVSAGTHPNLLHLTRAFDEKTKRFRGELTVDVVRRIVGFLGATAAMDGWRIVIIDALDDMNPNAANALLKSLEEPPRRTLFLLIAHVGAKVIPTIRSRCRAVRLHPLAESEVREILVGQGADPRLAASAQGSARRAFTLASAGAEVVERTQRLLAPRTIREVRQQHALADLAAQRRDGQFRTVVDLILAAFSDRVREGAGTAPIEVLEAYARAYLEASQEGDVVEEYNLDRKEYVLGLLDALVAADRQLART